MRFHSVYYSKFTFKVLTFALTLMHLQIPKIWQKKQQLNDEFQENTMLLALYNLIGLCEHDNDYHNYKQIVSIHSTKNEYDIYKTKNMTS